jgi:tripartite-type tricarboxylate transporter receptor subunit TctC
MALVTGDVDSMFTSPSTTLALETAGKLRMLAIAGPRRDPHFLDVPTLQEAGLPGFESDTWFGLMVAAHTPPDVLAKIRADAVNAMHSPAVIKRITDIGSIPVGNSSEEFSKAILSDYEIFKQVIANAK